MEPCIYQNQKTLTWPESKSFTFKQQVPSQNVVKIDLWDNKKAIVRVYGFHSITITDNLCSTIVLSRYDCNWSSSNCCQHITIGPWEGNLQHIKASFRQGFSCGAPSTAQPKPGNRKLP